MQTSDANLDKQRASASKRKSAQLKKSLDDPDKAAKKKAEAIKEDYNAAKA